MRCVECGVKMILSTSPIHEWYRGVPVVVEGVEHYSCPICGEYVLSAEALDEFERGIEEKYEEALNHCNQTTSQ